ncbi:hypothetical protein ACFL96_12515 [Thermoproteota archaeon]
MKKINWETITIKSLASLIGSQLNKHDIEVVLVGGACVSIYTKNKYLSFDLDLISYNSLKEIKTALSEIEFDYDKKKYFINKDCPYFLEFLSPPIAIGNSPVNKFNTIKTSYGSIKILTPTDAVKDRLAAYYHWDDLQCLEQAVLISNDQNINILSIKQWSISEKQIEKFNTFKRLIHDKTRNLKSLGAVS